MTETATTRADDDAVTGEHAGPGIQDADEFVTAQHEACDELAPLVGRVAACRAKGVPRSSWYKAHRQSPAQARTAPIPQAQRYQPRALSTAERDRVRDVLNSPEFVDEASATVWAKLLDGGVYHCLVSTMYRILREHGEVRERRRQATHPPRVKPEFVARGPNRVWPLGASEFAG